MKNRMVVAFVCGFMLSLASSQCVAGPTERLIERSGVQGGLVVCVGWDEPSFLCDLCVNERILVQGLARDEDKVRKARDAIGRKGLSKRVSASLMETQKLPYVEGVVNLLLLCDLDVQWDPNEIERVLCPGGAVCIRGERELAKDTLSRLSEGSGLEGWTAFQKAVPENIDAWSHFLHDASGNAVAEDDLVAPPGRLRWAAGPRWCRSHEFPTSVNAVVTCGGRIFMLFDEGPVGIYHKMPQDLKLVARDAFNGLLLWKVPLRQWQPGLGTGEGNRWHIHHTIPRRIVADEKRVYATLSFLESPVSVLDAATGEILEEEIAGTRGADELLLCDRVLVVKRTEGRSIGAEDKLAPGPVKDVLVGIDTASNETLWRSTELRLLPYAIAADAGDLLYHDMQGLVCLGLRDGKKRWRADNPIESIAGGRSTLVVRDGVALYHGAGSPGADQAELREEKGNEKEERFYLTAVSLDTGEPLWRHRGARSLAGACTQPTDVFVSQGVVWYGRRLEGLDLKTGEVRKKLELYKVISPGHHFRCHRAKATKHYMIWPKRGAEFIDLEGDQHMRCDWLRAPCFTGLVPANGLLYIPPSQCFCYPGVKVNGFLAMASRSEDREGTVLSHKGVLEKGKAEAPSRSQSGTSDWPMYRHDSRRSGSTRCAFSPELSLQWEKQLTCEGTQAVAVGDRLWIAEKDVHAVRCLDAKDGQENWRFIAGGRIDSAPTVGEGLVVFGCRDGWVYCLRAEDGALVWRFRPMPDERIVSFEQVESLWPIHGSVLVRDGVVYFAAGRSSFLDGGIVVCGVDLNSGKSLYRRVLRGPWPNIKEDTGTPFAMEGALPDLLVSDGTDLYMMRHKFDPTLEKVPTTQESSLGELDMGKPHLVATGGFLDDTGFDRLYWMFSRRWPGFYFSQHAPKAGQLVVFDDATTYSVKYFYRRHLWSPLFVPQEMGYLLFADDNENEPVLQEEDDDKIGGLRWLPEGAYSDEHRRGGRGKEKGTGYIREKPCRWQKMVPLRVRAMLAAGDHLLCAGLPDVVDSDDPTAALKGKKGAQLQAFSKETGELLFTRELSSPPVFDGLSAAQGRLYLATADGKLLCFQG